jgi:hypothetical protein
VDHALIDRRLDIRCDVPSASVTLPPGCSVCLLDLSAGGVLVPQRSRRVQGKRAHAARHHHACIRLVASVDAVCRMDAALRTGRGVPRDAAVRTAVRSGNLRPSPGCRYPWRVASVELPVSLSKISAGGRLNTAGRATIRGLFRTRSNAANPESPERRLRVAEEGGPCDGRFQHHRPATSRPRMVRDDTAASSGPAPRIRIARPLWCQGRTHDSCCPLALGRRKRSEGPGRWRGGRSRR